MSERILLESGTNEMEMLVFRVGDMTFGINVAKVRELIQRVETVKVPHSPPSVDGSFRLREEVLTLVNLGKFLGVEAECTDPAKGLIIVIELNKSTCGVLVDAVELIHRLRWDDIEPPSAILAQSNVPVTGTVMVDKRVVMVLDFETILAELLGVEAVDRKTAAAFDAPESVGAAVRILVADDSPTVRDSMERLLTHAGYEHVKIVADGQEAWDALQAGLAAGDASYDLVLTDVEMPRIDGLHLCARIREDVKLSKIPVILFSSIVRDSTQNKGEAVGANAQIAKTDPEGLLEAVRRCLQESPAAAG